MPARRVKSLHRPRGKSDKPPAAHEPAPIPVNPPPALKGDAVARATWRRVARLFNDTEVEILTRLDLPMLEAYCQLASRLEDIRALREQARTTLGELLAEIARAESIALKLPLYKAMRGAQIDVQKFDQSLNSTGRLVLDYARHLYLLPGSRGGVAPPGKPAPDPMAAEMVRAAKQYAKNGGAANGSRH